MNPTRLLLIGAIVAVGFLLLGKWIGFRAEIGQRQYDYAASLPETSSAPARKVAVAADTPAARANDEALLDDLPREATAPAGDASIEEEGGETMPTDWIEVDTGALLLQIDPRGGDIVRAALPRYPAVRDQPQQPLILLQKRAARQYIAHSGFIGPDGIDNKAQRPVYSSRRQNYRFFESAADGDRAELILQHETRTGVRIQKRFIFHRDAYGIDVRHRVINDSAARWRGNLFGQLKRDNFPDPQKERGGTFSPRSFLGVALFTPEKPYTKLNFKKLAENPFEDDVRGGWIAMVQHYFISAWIPEAQNDYLYRARRSRNGDYALADFVGPRITLAPGEETEVGATLYLGPKIQKSLNALAPGLELTVDYGWLWVIAQPLFVLLSFFNGWLHNWGAAIIALTAFIKLVFYPLNDIGYRSMAKMRGLQSQIQELRKRFPDDRQRQSMEMMKLYRERKVNPMGGCLPILVQMPFFLALYWVLLESVELRHAPLGGWIQDLSQMDPWFILPILMGVSMFFQQKLNPQPLDPMQARIMQWLPRDIHFLLPVFSRRFGPLLAGEQSDVNAAAMGDHAPTGVRAAKLGRR